MDKENLEKAIIEAAQTDTGKSIIKTIRKCRSDIILQELLIRRLVDFTQDDPLFLQKLNTALKGVTTNIRSAVSDYEDNEISEIYQFWRENRKTLDELPSISFDHLDEEYQNPTLRDYKSSAWVKAEIAAYFGKSWAAIDKAISRHKKKK